MKFLPPKQEYVISVRLSPLQIELYNKYLAEFTSFENSRTEDAAAGSSSSAAATSGDGNRGKFQCNGLFSDYQNLLRIWTHPWVLKLEEKRQDKKVSI
jgi:transcriptional regulator ATRX